MQYVAKLLFTLLFAVCAAHAAHAQLTLEGCKAMARDNYPAIRRYDLIEISREYTLVNATKALLPQVSAFIGTIYFTEMIDAKVYAVQDRLDNSLYNATLQISQTFYDGGAIAANKRIVRAQTELNRCQLEVELSQLDQRVEEVYFGILAAEARLGFNRLLASDIARCSLVVDSLVAHGIATEADCDSVLARTTDAQVTAQRLEATLQAYRTMLATLLGRPLDAADSLAMPPVHVLNDTVAALQQSPELRLFNAQEMLLEARRSKFKAALQPHLGAFGIAMYHNRVVDFMDRGLFAAGMTLSWDLGAITTRRGNMRSIDAQRQQIIVQREHYLNEKAMRDRQTLQLLEQSRRMAQLGDSHIAHCEKLYRQSMRRLSLGEGCVVETLQRIADLHKARALKAIHMLLMLQEGYKLH